MNEETEVPVSHVFGGRLSVRHGDITIEWRCRGELGQQDGGFRAGVLSPVGAPPGGVGWREARKWCCEFVFTPRAVRGHGRHVCMCHVHPFVFCTQFSCCTERGRQQCRGCDSARLRACAHGRPCVVGSPCPSLWVNLALGQELRLT